MVEVVLIGSQKNFLVSRYETNLNFTDSITFHANIYNEIIIIVINLSVGIGQKIGHVIWTGYGEKSRSYHRPS